jgi:hypothetical protein
LAAGVELPLPIGIEKRLVIALPIRVYGMGSAGKPFNQEAHTLDITHDGARIDGLPEITIGEIVGVQYGEEKSRYKVIWVGEPGGKREGQIGVQMALAGPAPWHKILEATPEELRWADAGKAGNPPTSAVVNNPPAGPPRLNTCDISQRVGRATEELQAIEKLIGSGAVDGRILQDFREAVNHVYQTSQAVQKWLELRDKK